jgi:2-keto-4-pentenoate hydratase/2-oxohepta-3-ene-1,7-dioic acid hydratase in catechol pathway
LKLLNFSVAARQSFGALVPGGVIDLGARLSTGAADLSSFIRSDLRTSSDTMTPGATCDYKLDEIKVLTPVGRCTRYFCIGVNYPERNEEYRDGSERPRYPSVFMRSHTSFVAHGEPVVRPLESEQLDYEGEIVMIIGRGGRRIPQETALTHVFGYTCANEGTVRDWLRHAKFNVTQGKNFDRSGSLGPWIVTADEIGSAPMRVTTRVNGEMRQDDTSDRMIFSMPYLISYLSTFCTLEAGDVILTGTPSGAGARFDPPRYLRPGDVVEVEVSSIGVLRNPVIADAA